MEALRRALARSILLLFKIEYLLNNCLMLSYVIGATNETLGHIQQPRREGRNPHPAGHRLCCHQLEPLWLHPTPSLPLNAFRQANQITFQITTRCHLLRHPRMLAITRHVLFLRGKGSMGEFAGRMCTLVYSDAFVNPSRIT